MDKKIILLKSVVCAVSFCSCLTVMSETLSYPCIMPFGLPDAGAPITDITGMSRLPENVDGAIFEAPEGAVMEFSQSGMGYVNMGGMPVEMEGNCRGTIVFCDNEDVYIREANVLYATGAFLRGKIEGNSIRVDLPQCVGSVADETGNELSVYANRMEYKETGTDDNGKPFGTFFIVENQEDNYVTYEIGEDGTVSLDLRDSMNLLGLTFNNDPHDKHAWTYFGDAYQYFSQTGETVTPPDDLVTEPWIMRYGVDGGEYHFVDMGFRDNEVYIRNITHMLPDSWIKGSVEGSRITIPGGQSLGINEMTYTDSYLVCSEHTNPEAGPNNGWTLLDAAVFEYDVEKKTMRIVSDSEGNDKERRLSVSMDPNDPLVVLESFLQPSISFIAPELQDAAPERPDIVQYMPYDEQRGFGGVAFILPAVNVNGIAIDQRRIYYNVLVDGDIFLFGCDEYNGLREDMTDIPYYFTDYYDINIYGDVREIYLYVRDIETVGVQSFYVGLNGEIFASEICETATDGVTLTEEDSEIETITYITADGKITDCPSEGFYIERRLHRDGSVSVVKRMSAKNVM